MSDGLKNINSDVSSTMTLILKDMAKYAPSKIFGLVGNAVIVPVYTNLMVPSEYGIYAISLAVLSFLCILFSDWIGLSCLRFFRRNQLEGSMTKYFSTLLLILMCNLGVMYLVSFVFRNEFYKYFSINPKIFLYVLILIIPVAIRALLFQVLRAQIKPAQFTATTIINQILTICIAVLLLKNTNLGAVSVLIAMAVSISVIDILLVLQTGVLNFLKVSKPDFAIVKTLFLYGLPISLASISLWAINQSNKFVTSHYRGLNEVGLVGVAYNMTFPILLTLFAIITIAAYPRLINFYEDKKDVKPLISDLTGLYMLISLPIVVVMALYAKDLVSIFVNAQYLDAFVLLPYFVFAAFFLSLTDYTSYQYHLANKTYVLTILKVISAVVGLCLNFYFIKNIGYVGVGIATLIANILYFLLTVVVVVSGLSWDIPYKRILHVLICFIPFVVVWYLLRGTTVYAISQIVILLLVYYGVFYFTKKFFDREVIS